MKINLAYLNGFRGLAAFWVLAAHCAIWGNAPIYILDPKIAVDVFIVMSGFLMAFTTIRKAGDNAFEGRSAITRFYIARYFRVAPVYYFALFMATVLAAPFQDGYATLRELAPERWASDHVHDPDLIRMDIGNLVMHMTFLFGLVPKYAQSTLLPDWSLGLEMQFYLAFPFIYMGMRRFGRIAVAGLLVLASAAFVVYSRSVIGDHGGRGIFPEPSFLLYKLHLFVVGIFLCEGFYNTHTNAAERRKLVVFAFAISLSELVFYRIQGLLFIAIVAAMIILASSNQFLAKPRIILSMLLGNRLMEFMARASYSVYLVHGFYIAILGAWLYQQPFFASMPPLSKYLAFTAAVTFCSYSTAPLIEKIIEQPGMKLGRVFREKLYRTKGVAQSS